jgi:hypothetical protein
LIKEKNFQGKVGTQVGMMAPGFECKTTAGELVKCDDFKGQLLIANVSGCTPRSYDCYNQLLSAYCTMICILGIENGNIESINGKVIDAGDKFNKDFYDKYRKEYSSYNCYLVNTDGRIINKFEVFDWEVNLSGLK